MDTVLEYVNSAGKGFVEFAGPMLVQSSVLIIILLITDLLLKKKVRAVLRYWLWMLVLAKLVLPIWLSSPVSVEYLLGDKLQDVKINTPITVASPTDIGTAPIEASNRTSAAMSETQNIKSAAAVPKVTVAPILWQGAVFFVWAAVAVVMVLLLLQRVVFVCGLVAQAKDANALMKDTLKFCCKQIGIKQTVGLKVSANATSPAVCGLYRPVILVPENLGSSLGVEHLRTVLLHELAHIKRGDLWVNLVQTLLQIIYFYNPLLWLANAMIRRVREQAADEAVLVAMGEKAQQYPQTLLSVARLAFKRPMLSLRLIGVVESKSDLKRRIELMLARPIPKNAKLGILGLVTVLIFAAVLLPMARAEKYTSGEKTFPETLNEEQKLYMEWTQERFGSRPDKSEYTKLSESAKKELEEMWIELLKGPECVEYYTAINGLAAIKSKRAVEPLLKIAAERIEKDNRYRWQAVMALGIVGNDSVIPELIHLVYHYNQNTRFWAQISLVRLTGENFGADWQKWANWWNSQKGKPLCSTEKVEWTSNTTWADPKEQKEMDEEFIEQLRENKKGETDKSTDRVIQGPMVIRTSPTIYADDVSPELKEITVTFNQSMMDRSWSWTGGGDTYPQTTGKPYYDSSRTTCTLPVKLEAGKVYWVGINSPSYKNFKTMGRVPAKRYVILFATKGPDGKPTPIPEDMLTEAKTINERAGKPEKREAGDTVEQAVMTISTCAENDPKVEKSLDSLKGLDEEAVVKELVKFLDSDKNTVRRSAIYILWKGNFKNIAPAVASLQKLCSHEEELTRGMAAITLGGCKVESSFDAICNMTLNDSSGYARRCAAYALGLMGRPDAKPVLEKALKDTDPLVRNNAEAALTMISQAEKNGEGRKSISADSAAVEAAMSWLKLIDDGDYGKSWDEAASIFKSAVTKEQWEISLKGVRVPLGKVISREVKSKVYTKQLPGAPDGEYVVIEFNTSFENKKVAIETVTPMKDKDGNWRVSGYYIK